MLDNEIKDMLAKLLEGQTMLKQGQLRLETELRKHSIKFETIEENIKIITEIQSSHKEQNETATKNTDLLIEGKNDLLETSLKSVSKDVKDIKESVEVLKDMTGSVGSK